MKDERRAPAARRPPESRLYAFPRTPLLITLPARFRHPAPVRAELRGVWRVDSLGRGRLAIADFRAAMLVPAGLRLTVNGRTRRLGRLRIDLRRADLPAGADELGAPNQGRVDLRARTLTATLGLRGVLPEALGGGSFPLAMRTFGSFDADGLQIGGGAGVVLAGLFLGTIVCCAGPRYQVRPDEPVGPPPPPPGVPVDVDPVVDEGPDTEPGDDDEKRRRRRLVIDAAKGSIASTVALFRRADIFGSIGRQLRAAGLPGARIKLKVLPSNGLRLIHPPPQGLAAMTVCGDPILISVNLIDCADPSVLIQILAHELVHAKECVYTRAGQPVPYGGHDTDAFKDKAKEFQKQAEDQQKKESDEAQKELDKMMGGHK